MAGCSWLNAKVHCSALTPPFPGLGVFRLTVVIIKFYLRIGVVKFCEEYITVNSWLLIRSLISIVYHTRYPFRELVVI